MELFTWLPLWGSCQRARHELLTERENFYPLRPKSWIWGTSPIGRGKSLHSFKLLHKLKFEEISAEVRGSISCPEKGITVADIVFLLTLTGKLHII